MTTYVIVVSLIVLQNVLFKILLSQREPFSILRMTVLIFINNSVANFTLFITFYLIIFLVAPIVIVGCKGGLLKREISYLLNHKVIFISITLVVMITVSILRVFYYINGGPAPPSQLISILERLVKLKHSYFEITGYMLGMLAVYPSDKKKVLTVHVTSYLFLLIGAYFEALLIPSH